MATTISISHETKEKLKLFGNVGDSYEDVIKKLYAIAAENLLLSYLQDDKDCYTAEEAHRFIDHG